MERRPPTYSGRPGRVTQGLHRCFGAKISRKRRLRARPASSQQPLKYDGLGALGLPFGYICRLDPFHPTYVGLMHSGIIVGWNKKSTNYFLERSTKFLKLFIDFQKNQYFVTTT